MSKIQKYENETIVAPVFKGTPNKTIKKELNTWRRFLRIITPWLNEKRILAEEILDAEVDKRRAEAKKTEAEAIDTLANAHKKVAETREIYNRIEKEKEQISLKLEIDDLEEQFKRLSDKLNYLRVVHGGGIVKIEQKNKDKSE